LAHQVVEHATAETSVETAVEAQSSGIGLDEWEGQAPLPSFVLGHSQHPGSQVNSDYVITCFGQGNGVGAGAAAQIQDSDGIPFPVAVEALPGEGHDARIKARQEDVVKGCKASV
jgi:hypothetical protein